MRKKLSKNIKGFTIIEVLIVLAIAAVIMLIVFLAVPALQRNNRNSQRKSDVAALLGGFSEYLANNDSKLPNDCSGTNEITLTRTSGSTKNTAVKVGYYNEACDTTAPASGEVQLKTAFSATAAGTLNSATEDYVIITPESNCSGDAVIAGSARQITAVYEVETGTNTYSQVCQSS